MKVSKPPISQVQINSLLFGSGLTFLAWRIILMLEDQMTAEGPWILELVGALAYAIHKLGEIAKQFALQGAENGKDESHDGRSSASKSPSPPSPGE